MTVRKSGLTTHDLYALDLAVSSVLPRPFTRGDTGARTYLVGTAQAGGEYRDVDVRTILPDDEFDALFTDPDVWQAWCFLTAAYLRTQTGLPIDYQVQRATEANAKYPTGGRNPLGLRAGRRYAGGGDATPWNAP